MTLLDEIVAEVRKQVEGRKRKTPADQLPNRSTERRSLVDAIRGSGGVPIIAEIKRKSPSIGVLRRDFDVITLAKAYESGGAIGISILTEPSYFGGSLENLIKVKESVGIPILRKDFIIDEYQVHESAAHGADSVLLIASCLSDDLKDFLVLTDDLGLEALVECHSEQEVEKAVEAGAEMIGINNRDLRTLEIDLNITKKLAKHVPDDRILVSESGVKSPEDVKFLLNAGASAVLVGTALIKAQDPKQKLIELRTV